MYVYMWHTVALIGLRIVAQASIALMPGQRIIGSRRRRRRRRRRMPFIGQDVQTFVAASCVVADLRINVARHILRVALVDVLALAALCIQNVPRWAIPGATKRKESREEQNEQRGGDFCITPDE